MTDITKEQAVQIHDIESYKEVTGAKRFKRSKEEMSLGLDPEESLQRRLKTLKTNAVVVTVQKQYRKTALQHKAASAGVINIRVRPASGVDTDYFERLQAKLVEIELDEKTYGWLDTKLQCPYDNDLTRLITDMLEKGLGEIITTINFPKDLENA